MRAKGTQGPVEDPRNGTALVYVDGHLVPRAEARVSIFDAGFVLGDGVWEGFRLVDGTLVFEKDHLDRPAAGARAIGIDLSAAPDAPAAALRHTIEANGMQDDVHIRLMVTRRTSCPCPARCCGRCAARSAPRFDPAMLSWPPGRRPTNGVWAPYWYAAAEESTGFGPPPPPAAPLPAPLARIAEAARPHYEKLARWRLC